MAKTELEGVLFGIEADYGDGGLTWTYLVLDGHAPCAQVICKLKVPTSLGSGRVRITIEQIDRDKSPEAVAKRAVERHKGTLDILEEIG